MTSLKKSLVLACSAIGAIALLTDFAAAQSEPISIGIGMPIGGQNGEYVKRSFVMPTEFAAKEINAKGGVLGRQIKVTVEDTRNDPSSAVAALTKMINVDKIIAVFTAFTPLTLPQLPIAEENKVIVVAGAMEHPDLTKSRWAVRMTPTADKAGPVIAEAAQKLGIQTAAILSEENEAVRVTARSFTQAFQKQGGRILGDETFKIQDSEMRGQLTKLRAARPDMIYVITSRGRSMGLALKQIRESGIKLKQIFSNQLVEDKEIAEIGGNIAEGVIYTTLDVDPEFAARWRQANGFEPDSNAAKNYDATMLFFEAIKRANSTDPAKIRDAIYNFGPYKGTVGDFRFEGSGEPIVFPILKIIKDGKFVNYKP
jgi:branched-chain amino acid transport system substrate-binding protein